MLKSKISTNFQIHVPAALSEHVVATKTNKIFFRIKDSRVYITKTLTEDQAVLAPRYYFTIPRNIRLLLGFSAGDEVGFQFDSSVNEIYFTKLIINSNARLEHLQEVLDINKFIYETVESEKKFIVTVEIDREKEEED